MRTRLLWEGAAEAVVPASPSQVWAVLTDVTRVGEWSHECHTAQWGDGDDGPRVDATFQGSNRAGRNRWTRVCTITECVPGERFAYVTSGGLPRDSTEWTFVLTPEGEGTRVRQGFRILRISRFMELVIVALVPAHRDRRAALREDLVRLGRIAASAGVGSAREELSP